MAHTYYAFVVNIVFLCVMNCQSNGGATSLCSHFPSSFLWEGGSRVTPNSFPWQTFPNAFHKPSFLQFSFLLPTRMEWVRFHPFPSPYQTVSDQSHFISHDRASPCVPLNTFLPVLLPPGHLASAQTHFISPPWPFMDLPQCKNKPCC